MLIPHETKHIYGNQHHMNNERWTVNTDNSNNFMCCYSNRRVRKIVLPKCKVLMWIKSFFCNLNSIFFFSDNSKENTKSWDLSLFIFLCFNEWNKCDSISVYKPRSFYFWLKLIIIIKKRPAIKHTSKWKRKFCTMRYD